MRSRGLGAPSFGVNRSNAGVLQQRPQSAQEPRAVAAKELDCCVRTLERSRLFTVALSTGVRGCLTICGQRHGGLAIVNRDNSASVAQRTKKGAGKSSPFFSVAKEVFAYMPEPGP